MEIEIQPGEYEVLPPENLSAFKKFYFKILDFSSSYGGWKLVLGLCLFFYALIFVLPYPSQLSMRLPADALDAKTVVFGSNSGFFIFSAKQYFRLVTANFLHFGLIHLGSNLLGLYIIGGLLQKIWDARSVFILFLITGIGANLLTLFIKASNSAGASGGVFGLMGGLLAYFLWNKSLDKALRDQMLKQLGSILALNLFIGIVVPSIDLIGHFGGLITGVVLGKIFLLSTFSKKIKINFWIWFFLVLCVIVALIFALISYFFIGFL